MNLDTDYVNKRLFDAIDPNNSYTIEDFDTEFNSINQPDITDLKMPINFINKSNNEDPEFQTDGAAGFDFRANLPNEGEVIVIQPSGSGNNISMIPTGLFFELPETLELQVRPRSGLAAKNGVTVLNSPGTVDSDYRGEVKVILINHGTEDFVINNGDRIAQGVLSAVSNRQFINLNKVDELSVSERGDNGFGSTGVK
tara:strand:- start:64488 stop:65081 length:594 start_codon:yes stop_codon:yes gene_type:complete